MTPQNSTHRPTRRRRFMLRSLFFLLLVSCLGGISFLPTTAAWEWTDFLGGVVTVTATGSGGNTLTMDQVREMRVRDIKRRLSRHHGYSAEELGRILDKAELIQALSFEEHKERTKFQQELQRTLLIRGIVLAIVAIVVIAAWPVWVHLYEVASVNLVVYLDRKKYEANRCIELQSIQGMIGVLLMAIVDLLSIWLTASVALSWFMASKYFFPTPNLSFRPAAMMGGEVARGPLSKYGLNIGPMALSWAFRFVNGRLETMTGKALSKAYQRQKQQARQWESPEEKAARKAARRAAKKAAKEEAERQRVQQEEAEQQRRKEAADQATQHLFGSRNTTTTSNNNNNKNDGDESENDKQQQQNEDAKKDYDDANREFLEEMENMDMNDLD